MKQFIRKTQFQPLSRKYSWVVISSIKLHHINKHKLSKYLFKSTLTIFKIHKFNSHYVIYLSNEVKKKQMTIKRPFENCVRLLEVRSRYISYAT